MATPTWNVAPEIECAVESLVEAIEGISKDSGVWILPRGDTPKSAPSISGSERAQDSLRIFAEPPTTNVAVPHSSLFRRHLIWDLVAGILVVGSIFVALAILG